MYVYIFIYLFKFIYLHVYIFIFIYIYIYIYIYIQVRVRVNPKTSRKETIFLVFAVSFCLGQLNLKLALQPRNGVLLCINL